MPDFLLNESDEAIAEMMGLTIEEFRGEVPYDPQPDLSHLPCGQDDAVMDRIDSNKQSIILREKWGRDTEGLTFMEYQRKYWQD